MAGLSIEARDPAKKTRKKHSPADHCEEQNDDQVFRADSRTLRIYMNVNQSKGVMQARRFVWCEPFRGRTLQSLGERHCGHNQEGSAKRHVPVVGCAIPNYSKSVEQDQQSFVRFLACSGSFPKGTQEHDCHLRNDLN